MLAAIGLQIAAVAVLALVAGLATGMDSARFLLLGGAVAIVPNALFALRLALHRKRSPESYPVVFFLGEFAKIGLTVGLLAWIVKSVPDIRWLPLLIGLIVALKAPLFALAFVRSLPQAKGSSL
ncbi:MAG TPA: ATP synthase subunit I [Zeimonas sp.]|nr:ATP synthase subunit I [Zeimonas sp.]